MPVSPVRFDMLPIGMVFYRVDEVYERPDGGNDYGPTWVKISPELYALGVDINP